MKIKLHTTPLLITLCLLIPTLSPAKCKKPLSHKSSQSILKKRKRLELDNTQIKAIKEGKETIAEQKKEKWRNRKLTDTDKMDMILKTGEGVVAGGIIGGIAHAVVTSASIVIAASPAIVATSEAATAGGAATVTGKAAAVGTAKIAAAATGTAISLPAAITLGTIAGGILGCSWAFNKWKKANS